MQTIVTSEIEHAAASADVCLLRQRDANYNDLQYVALHRTYLSYVTLLLLSDNTVNIIDNFLRFYYNRHINKFN